MCRVHIAATEASGLSKTSDALCDQPRTVRTGEILRLVGSVTEEELHQIVEAIKRFVTPKPELRLAAFGR